MASQPYLRLIATNESAELDKDIVFMLAGPFGLGREEVDVRSNACGGPPRI